MGKVAWFFLAVFFGFAVAICAYAGAEVYIWLIAKIDEPEWMKYVATLLRKAFGTGNEDQLRSALEVLVTGLIGFLTGAVATDKKSLWLIGACGFLILMAATAYFLIEPGWGIYGGAPTLAAIKEALVAVARLNIMLLGAHLGVKLNQAKQPA